MQSLCRECRKYKPDSEVKFGVCDECYQLGAPRNAVPPVSARPVPADALPVPDIILTTALDVPRREVESVISIVAAEAAIGINFFRDLANVFRDAYGGRSITSQNALREARALCLDDLKREAAAVGADAVVAVDFDYNEITTNHGAGGGILFVAASGTAVKLAQGAVERPLKET